VATEQPLTEVAIIALLTDAASIGEQQPQYRQRAWAMTEAVRVGCNGGCERRASAVTEVGCDGGGVRRLCDGSGERLGCDGGGERLL